MAPLLAAASQHPTTLFRAHPFAKSVHAFAAAIVRLIRPLHNVPSGEKVLSHTLGGRQPLIISTPKRKRKQTVRRLPSPLVLLLAAMFGAGALPAAASQGELWLVAGDVHLDPFDRSPGPNGYGRDADAALFDEAVERMRRVAPDPAVVVLTGDFLAHRFPSLAARYEPGVPPERPALEAMRRMAGALGHAFPRARFVVTLGNNDAPCGDYRAPLTGPYLTALARVWAPLVARGGDAAEFVRDFARGGYYALTLTGHRRVVVLNSVLFSLVFAGDCRGDERDAGLGELVWLRQILARPHDGKTIVVMHIPPGYDAQTTTYVRGLVAWPFLEADANAALDALIASPRNRIAFVLSGHAHRFDFRLAGNVPIVTFGSLSPIYGNNPAFYTLRVAKSGALSDIVEFTYDVESQRWSAPRSFDQVWGAGVIVDAASLAWIHARLGSDPAMRERWQRQADGWPSRPPAAGIWLGWWRPAYCAQTFLDDGFTRCAGVGARRVALIVAAALLFIVTLAFLLLLQFARGGTTLKPP
jgi:Calcineurin-like phosphoesterase